MHTKEWVGPARRPSESVREGGNSHEIIATKDAVGGHGEDLGMVVPATLELESDKFLANSATTGPEASAGPDDLLRLDQHPQNVPEETLIPGNDAPNTATTSPPLRPIPNYRCTPRDLNILQFIGENGFATGRDVCSKFFGNEGNNLHLRRLRKLRKMGFVAHLIGDRDMHLGYSITRKGRARLEEEGVALPPGKRRGVYKSNYTHDLQLQQIRRILEQSPLVSNFKTEIELRSETAKAKGRPLNQDDLIKVPDGSFTLICPTRVLKVALELELAPKSDIRYRKMLRALCTLRGVHCTFILCRKETTMTRLRSLLKEVRAKDPYVVSFPDHLGIYFGLAPEFLSKGLNGKFVGEGKTFTIKGLGATDSNAEGRVTDE